MVYNDEMTGKSFTSLGISVAGRKYMCSVLTSTYWIEVEAGCWVGQCEARYREWVFYLERGRFLGFSAEYWPACKHTTGVWIVTSLIPLDCRYLERQKQ